MWTGNRLVATACNYLSHNTETPAPVSDSGLCPTSVAILKVVISIH
jgi:hypothetical protein